MKTVKLFFLAVLVAAMPLLNSCGNGTEKEVNPLADSLQAENNKKDGELTEKEAAIQDFVTAFNEIQGNLNEIKEKEKIVSSSAKSGDVKSKEDQIKEDIQAIYALMAKNKASLGAVSKKLKNANTKIDGLEQMLANLEAQLNEKDVQINDLKNQIEQLNIELSNLNLNYEDLAQQSEAQTEKMNTVYYAIGTSKELKEKNVITKEGGFIGMGKTTTLKSDFNKDYFTKADASNLSSITIGAKKAKIITTHPSSSYKLVGEKPVEKLEITNAEEFWGTSKYLVIIIEN
jgi:septal ring factor EnvC (AmiA/AmiB activator)